VPRFNAPPLRFGRRPATPDQDVPTPAMRRAQTRRTIQLAEAAAVLPCLPGPGESLHCLMTGRYDLMHLLVALQGKLGTIERLRIATLSYNARNLDELLALLDGGAVKSLTLLCSAFFRDHNKDLWQKTLARLRQRGHRAAAARSHAKVITLAMTDGRHFVLEGSANLRTNSNQEQLAVFADEQLHDWHAQWIDALVTQHEGEAKEDD
jgi:hypothetical protein